MKKNFLTVCFFLISASVAVSQDTFSIVAIDSVTGEVGSAGASCIGAPQNPQGCSIISDVHPGVGVIHSQAFYIPPNQDYAGSLMDQGFAPQQIIDSLVANDAENTPTIRQYGVVDFTGAAAYTGVNCFDYKNHIVGTYYSIQGNTLLDEGVLDSMLSRFLHAPGELACKLMAALQGAKVPGADNRCLEFGISSLSSFIRVARPSDTTGSFYLDLNVPGIPYPYMIDPIDSLQTLFNAWGACPNVGVEEISSLPQIQITPNPAADRITLTSQIVMKRIEIFSMARVPLWEESIDGTKKNEIDLSDFHPGIVLAQITFMNGMRENKLIVIQ